MVLSQTPSANDQFAALCANDGTLAKLRSSIREFLHGDRELHGWRPEVDSWLSCWDEEFSARLGAAGFLGITIPRQYGGAELGHLHRYVIIEELLAQGAPVAAHWIADRQVAPALLAYGTEEQRQRILPRIAAGRFYSAIGMSEHGAGSDLAAVQTRATKTDRGWSLSGAKVWTSGAHHADQIVVLARTSALDPEHRHEGFTQFLVPCDAPGITIDPITLMSGEHHFNEVLFDDVHVSDADVLGQVGAGWHQVTSELAFERSGPERILTTMPLISAAIDWLATRPIHDDATATDVGHLIARLMSLRQLSVAVARALVAGEPAANQAALVKDLGTSFEQESVDLIADLFDRTGACTDLNPELQAMLATAWLHRPLFTLRGGTNEVLRGVVARGMGLR
ncbi:acyl-CoA dehydrogenase family protein [Mycolicibacterium stellerae]|uniref:acyl-CoA dehydrogenase family protein n=1 Tax=Mycolicibacterium stellerae TaxID=2358193 RepID=UPI000F0B1047|nr:acyl-CoA dehydrogenase family protein [Mycolicibacterium stellerae]